MSSDQALQHLLRAADEALLRREYDHALWLAQRARKHLNVLDAAARGAVAARLGRVEAAANAAKPAAP